MGEKSIKGTSREIRHEVIMKAGYMLYILSSIIMCDKILGFF